MGLMFKTLAKQNLRYKGFLIFYLFMVLITAAASVFATRLTGDMGQAAISMDMGALLKLFGFITIIMLIQAIASAVSALYLGRFAGKAGYRFRDNFAKYFLQKPFSAYEDNKSGESLSVFQNDLPASVELVSNGGIRMIADIVTLIVTFAYMMYLNWWLTLIFFASFPVLIIVQVLIAAPIQKKEQKVLEKKAGVNAYANDSFQNTSTVIAYSLEEIMIKRLSKAYEELIIATKNSARSFLFLILAGILASMSPILIIIAVSAAQVIAGNMDIAEWLAFTNLAMGAGTWLTMLSQRQNQVQSSAAGANRLDGHMAGEPEDGLLLKANAVQTPLLSQSFSNDDTQKSQNARFGGLTSKVFAPIGAANSIMPSGNIAICAENIKFAYGGKSNIEVGDIGNTSAEPPAPPLALDDVSFTIEQGSRVAFVGGSGSGKSTILKLLLGLYNPQEGKIAVMGADTADIPLASLRETYAYVPQDSYLFPESILGNITGESAVSDLPRLEKACRDAGILDFINSLPDGFDTVLNEAAENLSGGQKQRIALARAFYRDAPVILFDEATSALDPATETAVLQSFCALSRDKTVVMVAHRLKAIDFCDRIVVMDNGKIAASGTHDELIKNSPIYANLYQAREKEVTV
ncbi:MAG: ABC transporter ATP-binding protein/permease [Lachnospiraceae bacterium]|nr:ABC transporter ATP-binding protein/permease [Lachnospiraceae bacterium]